MAYIVMRTCLLVTLLFAAALHADVVRSFQSCEWISYANGKKFHFQVTAERVLKAPVWKSDDVSPPLAARKADELATAKFRQLIPDWDTWKRERIVLEDLGDGLHWIYVVEFMQTSSSKVKPPFLNVIVLMDGTVVEPRIQEDK